MKRSISFATLTIVSFSLSGCSQQTPTTNPPAASVASSTQREPVATKSGSVEKNEAETNKSEPTPVIATQTSTAIASASVTEPAKLSEPQNKTQVEGSAPQSVAPVVTSPEPTTATASLQVVDLKTFPQINAKSALELGSTYVYYSGESSIKGADAFYQSEFKMRGWTESQGMTPPTEQYVDRTYTKDGYYVRCTVSNGSKEGEVGVNISNLGNVDVRLLPMMPDAIRTESTAVNAGHETASSIVDVAKTLSKKLVDLGWQEVREFFKPETDVPHYRSIEYRKNAARIMLGIYKDPKNPAEKTKVFYHAEFVIPFDVPTFDSSKILKLDLNSKRAAFEFDGDEAAMQSLIEKSSNSFGWKLRNAEQFKKGDAGSLIVSTGPEKGMIAKIVTDNDQRSIALEYLAMPDAKPKANDAVTANVAATPAAPNKSKAKTEADAQFDSVQSEVNKTIELELQKALGSLNGAGGVPKANMQDLQAKAAAMLQGLQDADSTDIDSKDSDNLNGKKKSDVNPFVATNDKEPIEQADLAIKSSQCVIKTSKETFTLKHLLAYNQVEDGVATKVLMFSNKPLNEDKLKRMLASGKSVSIYEIGGFDSGPTIEMKISDSSVMINASVAGASMSTNAGEMKSTVRYRDGKVVGRVMLDKPMKMFDDTFAFEAQVNQPVLTIDWKPSTPGQVAELTADSEYDFPLPENCGSKSIEGTKYLKQVEASVEAPLQNVDAFYRKEFATRGYKETKVANALANSMAFANAGGSIDVRLTENAGSTTIAMNVQNGAAAKADKIVASPGKVLALMGNLSNEPVEVTIGGKAVQLAVGAGAKDPKDATRLELAPGKYQVVWKMKSGKTAKEDLEVTANTTWGVIFDLDFQTVMRLY